MPGSDDATCPSCGGAGVIPIVYGMPDEELVMRDAAGEAVIGGVVEYDDSPTSHCRECGHRWGRLGHHSGADYDHDKAQMDTETAARLAAELERQKSAEG